MGDLIRSKRDWSASKLGPPATWPQSLRTALSIVLTSRFPMIIFWGPDLCVLYNDAYIPIFGAKHPEVLGKTGYEAWGEVWDVISPMFRTVQRGEATWSEDAHLALHRRGFTEETYLTWSYSPIRDESGSVGGVFTAVQENTDRVLEERRLISLRELAERLAETKTVEDAAVVAIETLAKNDRDVPFAAMYLVEGDRARRCAVHSLADAAAPTSFALEHSDPWRIAEVVKSGLPQRVEGIDLALPSGPWPEPSRSAFVLPIAQPGEMRPHAVLVAGLSPRLVFDDKYANFFALAAQHTATAISNALAYEEERKRLAALAEIDRAKTAFFSNVSHELRTPLTLILGPMEDALSSPERALAGEDLETSHRNAIRLLKLVNALLDFSRIEAGRVKASFEPTDLAAFTRELASVFRSAMERAGLRFVIDAVPLASLVYVDREMWEKIVLNLLSNALKFTFDGEVSISLKCDGAEVVLTVRDTGTGVPAAEVPHLFERFHRVEGAKARTHEGSGIGLALVYELVKLHGGTIHVDSVEGRGTTFEIRIRTGSAHLPTDRVSGERTPLRGTTGAAPYVEEALRWMPGAGAVSSLSSHAEEPFDTRDAGGLTHIALSSERILVVDDNIDMREYVARLLGSRWSVEAHSDGAAALNAIRLDPPDLVLSDVMMPGLDGFGLLRELRADPATRTVPVILLSARAGEEATAEGLHAGAHDYLIKPFSARELLARVGAQLTIAKLRREANAEREAQQKVIEATFNQAPGAIALLSGPNFVIKYINATALMFWQRTSADQVLEKGVLDALPELRGTGYIERLRQVVQTGTPFLANEAPVVVAPPGKAATTFFLNVTYAPTRDAQGAIDGVAVFGFDVTAQVVARSRSELGAEIGRAFASNEPLAQQLIHCCEAMVRIGAALARIWTYNGTHEVLELRASAGMYTHIDGGHARVPLGTLKIGQIAATRRPHLSNNVIGDPLIAQEWAKREGLVSFAGYPLVAGDRLMGVVGMFAKHELPDEMLSALASVADQIALGIDRDASERFRELFIGMLGHDLRNPLNAVLMGTQLMSTKAREPDQQRTVTRIQNSARRMERMITQLLDFTRARSGGGIPLDRIAADVTAICTQAVDELSASHPERVVAEYRGDGRGLWDPDRLAQVLSNLIGNALSHGRRDAVVRVTVDASDAEVRVSVHNEGPPIPPDTLPSIFDPFRRARFAKLAGTQGLGLGLFISHQIVLAHLGSLTVQSTEAGGTTFVMTLPKLRNPS